MGNTWKRKRVLIAEDEGCLRRLLEELCEAAGFQVDAVYEGRAAWALLSALADAYALVFLDICLPEWSGDDVLAMMNTLSSPRKFVIVISGFLDSKLRAEFECHPNVFRILDKPFSTKEIASILHDAVVANSIEEVGPPQEDPDDYK